MKINELEELFKEAIRGNYNYIGIVISLEDYTDDEVVIITRSNMEKKLEFYKERYTENLTMKTNENIKIIDCYYSDNLLAIEGVLILGRRMTRNKRFK